MDEHTISPAGDPFFAAARRTDQDDQPHGCIGGVVYIGHLLEGEEGAEVEVIDAAPCRRCRSAQ